MELGVGHHRADDVAHAGHLRTRGRGHDPGGEADREDGGGYSRTSRSARTVSSCLMGPVALLPGMSATNTQPTTPGIRSAAAVSTELFVQTLAAIALRRCANVGGALQDVCVRFAARDESGVQLVLVQRHVVAVNRLACRLLQSGEVHHGTAHRVVQAPPLRDRLEKMRPGLYPVKRPEVFQMLQHCELFMEQ